MFRFRRSAAAVAMAAVMSAGLVSVPASPVSLSVSAASASASAVKNLKATYKNGSIKVTWTKTKDADAYRVSIKTSKNGKYQTYKSVSGNSCTISDIKGGETVYIAVTSLKKSGSSYKAGKSATTSVKCSGATAYEDTKTQKFHIMTPPEVDSGFFSYSYMYLQNFRNLYYVAPEAGKKYVSQYLNALKAEGYKRVAIKNGYTDEVFNFDEAYKIYSGKEYLGIIAIVYPEKIKDGYLSWDNRIKSSSAWIAVIPAETYEPVYVVPAAPVAADYDYAITKIIKTDSVRRIETKKAYQLSFSDQFGKEIPISKLSFAFDKDSGLAIDGKGRVSASKTFSTSVKVIVSLTGNNDVLTEFYLDCDR